MMMHGGMSMFLWMMVQWGFLLLGIYLLIRWIKKDHSQKSNSEDHAMNILRERYAKGEISEEEFDRMLGRLRKD